MDTPLPVNRPTHPSLLSPLLSFPPPFALADTAPAETAATVDAGSETTPAQQPLVAGIGIICDSVAMPAAEKPPPPNLPTGAQVQTPPAQPGGKWHCKMCQRTLQERERSAHLGGNPHRKRQVAWEAAEKHRVKEELARQRAAGMSGSDGLAPGVHPDRIHGDADILVRVTAAQPGMWQCIVCQRTMMSISKTSHLQGSPHAINQVRWDAERQKEKVEAEELRRTEQISVEEAKRNHEQERREEMRRAEEIRVQKQKRLNEVRLQEELRKTEEIRLEGEKQKDEQMRREEMLKVVAIRLEEEKRADEEKKREALRRTEQIRIEEEQRTSREENMRKAQQVQIEQFRIQEEKRWMVEQLRIKEEEETNRIKKAKIDRENAAAADEQLRITQDNQRKEWMRRQEESAEAARQMEWQLRNEQEDRRKKWMRKQEEAATGAWRMEEQIRIEEENRRKEWAMEQEEQATAAWRMEEQLRIEEENSRKVWLEKQQQEAAAAWLVVEQFRLQQEKCRKESMRRLENAAAAAAAAEYTRKELLRKQAEEETRRTQALQSAEEDEYAQRMAEQVQDEVESRQTDVERQQQQQMAGGLTHGQVEIIPNVRGQSGVMHNFSSPGSSIGPTGYSQQVVRGIQNNGEGASHFNSRSDETAIRRYLQWQAIIHEMHQQQVWVQQPVTMTIPMPVTSVTDISPILYRVYDETSVSKYSWDGFTAAASCMPQDAFNFKNMVNFHGNWSSREGTPFISVTCCPNAAAWQVAIRQASRNEPNIMVALIDTAALLGQCRTSVWKMHDARDHFGLQPWKCHRRAYDNEYICALRIPAKAIFACCQPAYFRQNALIFLDNLAKTTGMERRDEMYTSEERSL